MKPTDQMTRALHGGVAFLFALALVLPAAARLASGDLSAGEEQSVREAYPQPRVSAEGKQGGMLALSQAPLKGRSRHATPSEPAAVPKARVHEAFGKLPLYFIENQGQLDARVAYYVQGRDTSVYFTFGGRHAA